jgi:hypothetical protein
MRIKSFFSASDFTNRSYRLRQDHCLEIRLGHQNVNERTLAATQNGHRFQASKHKD